MLKLTSLQKKLFEALQGIDSCLGKIYLGLLQVKDDSSNPDWLAHAAHSARELCNALLRRFDIEKDLHHRQKLQQVVHTGENAIELDPFVSEKGESLATEWHKLHDWFTKISHHEKSCLAEEFTSNWEKLEVVLAHVLSPSCEKIEELDVLLQVESPTREHVKKAISSFTKQGYYDYFLNNLNSLHWLKPLRAEGVFAKPPDPIPVGAGMRFPVWSASRYLVKIADKEPTQVLEIIKEVRTENFRVHEDFVDATLKMPASLAKQVIPLIPDWIVNPYAGHSLLSEKLSDLVVKLSVEREVEAALNLARTLLGVTIDKPIKTAKEETEIIDTSPDAKSYFTPWVYGEIVEKVVPSLVKASPVQTIKILADKLAKAIRLKNEIHNIKEDEYDLSCIWRPAIEGHVQNRHPGSDINDILVSSLRDALTDIGKNNIKNIPEALSELRQYRYPIFRRIELHILRIFPDVCRDRIIEILSNKEAFDDAYIHHEYFLLLQAQFSSLPIECQKRILGWAEEGPDLGEYKKRVEEKWGRELTPGDLERYKRSWQLEKLSPIKDSLPENWRPKCEQLVAEFGQPEHPEFTVYTQSWSGPTSPLTKEELDKKTPAEILDYLAKWEPPKEIWAPSPEGLGRTLAEVVKSRPEEFAQIAPEFLRQKVRPIYIYHLIQGFRESLKENKCFGWEPVIGLCEEITKSALLPEPEVSEDEREVGWRGVRKVICDLLHEGFNKSKLAVPFSYKERVWSILEEMVKDEEPTLEYEQKYGGTNMDPFTLSINTVRGQAFHSAIAYALWCARQVSATGSSRMPPEIKAILTRYLDIEVEPTLTVRSVYGHYLPNLIYLDKDWVNENLKRIFPPEEGQREYWKAAWEAYVIFQPPYDNVYSMIKEEYQRAIDSLGKDHSLQRSLRDPDYRSAEHLIILYWRGKETLDGGSLLDQFFKKAPASVRGHAINFIGRELIGQNNQKGLEQVVLERLKRLWEHRILKARTAFDNKRFNEEKFSEELKEFGWWFSQNPFEPAWAIERFKETVDLTNGEIERSKEVVEELLEYVGHFPVQVLGCLYKIVVFEINNRYFLFWKEECQTILRKANQFENKEVANIRNKIINYLVLKGYTEFKDLL